MPTSHGQITNAADIHQPFQYVQSSDPGAVGAGKWWYDTSVVPGVLKYRNAGNTGWDVVAAGGNTTELAFTQPPSSSWSWVNQGSATIATDNYGELLTLPSSGGDNWRMRVRSFTATSTYTITARLDILWTRTGSGNMYAGLILRDSASSKFVILGLRFDGSPEQTNLYEADWTNNTTVSATNYNQNITKLPYQPLWFRFRIASGTRFIEVSPNGIDWYAASTSFISSTGFITPDQIGFGGNDAAATPPIVRLRSWSVS